MPNFNITKTIKIQQISEVREGIKTVILDREKDRRMGSRTNQTRESDSYKGIYLWFDSKHKFVWL